MKLGTKIAGGFGILLVLAIALGVVGIVQMLNVNADATVLAEKKVPTVADVNALERNLNACMFVMRAYAYTENTELFDTANKSLQAAKADIATALDLADKQKLDELKTTMTDAKAKVEQYEAKAVEGKETVENLKKVREERWVKSQLALDNANDYLKDQEDALANELGVQKVDSKDAAANKADPAAPVAAAVLDPKKIEKRVQKIHLVNELVDRLRECRTTVWKAESTRNNKLITDNALPSFPVMQDLIAKMRELTALERNKQQLNTMEASIKAYNVALNQYLDESTHLANLAAERTKVSTEVQELAQNSAKKAVEETTDATQKAAAALSSASYIMVGGLIIAVIVGLILAWVITVSITGPINRIIAGLTSSSEQTSAAAGQISSASQQLAEGATEQAASLEETSSALEEMASMTRQNADNAGSANNMMTDNRKQVAKGAQAVKNMSGAMGQISESSDQISKIIKTIEEIAFQTNLLALNAAVEAARAGDAGKGFAVVADEVRNLAQRSAQAARDTAELIEGTVDRVKNGTAIVEELEKSFAQVEEGSAKVASLVEEISAASNEQAQGVDQVNTAVAQMDKVTQSNAANAEESASASEELSAQAEQLNQMVQELSSLVGGAAASQGVITQHAAMHPAHKTAPLSTPHLAHKPLIAHHDSKAPAKKKDAGPKVVKPEEAIPFDDDFKEF